jgi:hypothetical protein
MQNLREKKDRRMKIIAIGGAVLLAAILAFEMPHYLGGSKSTASAASTTTTTTAAAGTPMPATGTATGAVMATSSSVKLTTSDLLPVRKKSQLYAFSHFSSKNPFVPQVSNSTSTSSSGSTGMSGSTGSSGSSGSSGTASSGSTSGSQSAAKGVSGSTSSSSNAANVSATANSAMVEVNGKIQPVPVGVSFPSSNPVFKLVSVTSKGAKIGISNGGFSDGKATVSVAVGRSLTLVNKTNGRRYVLLLLSVS